MLLDPIKYALSNPFEVLVIGVFFIIGSFCNTVAYGQWQTDPHAVINLGDLGSGLGWANGMNENGLTVGTSPLVNGKSHAFVWGSGRMLDLGTLGGSNSEAHDINNVGDIVGFAQVSSQDEHAFMRRGGIMTDLGTLGGAKSWSWAISDNGIVVGESEYKPGSGISIGFYWDGFSMNHLGTLSNQRPGSSARDINTVGQIVGYSRPISGADWRAVIWEDGIIHDLGSPSDSWGMSINDAGKIAGQFYSLDAGAYHAFFLDAGVWTDIHGDMLYLSSAAAALNNYDEAVGWIGNSALYGKAYKWDAINGYVLLNDLQSPNSRWDLKYAQDINDLGQIVGYGDLGEGNGWREAQAYMMTRVYPSFDLGEVMPGIAGQINTIQASNLTPGTKVYFVYGRFGGGSIIPGCDVSVNALQIEGAKPAGSAVADANGFAILEGMIPAGIQGKQLLFQAVVFGDCAISNLVVQQIN